MRINMPVTDEEYVLPLGEVIVTRTDLQGNITYANEAFLRSSGFSRSSRRKAIRKWRAWRPCSTR